MALIVNDTFTDTNGTTLQSHTGETGATWTKHTVSMAADGKISANRLYLDSAGGADVFYYASGSPASAEYDVQADFVCLVISGAAGRTQILGRINTAAHTWYKAYWDAGSIWLDKLVAGASTNLGQYVFTAVESETHTIKLQIRDAAKKVFVDGVERISSADNAITAAGKSGLGWLGAQTTTDGIHLDNFSVNDLAEEEASTLSEDYGSFPMHVTAQKRTVTVFA